jgi:hypothetical protein
MVMMVLGTGRPMVPLNSVWSTGLVVATGDVIRYARARTPDREAETEELSSA